MMKRATALTLLLALLLTLCACAANTSPSQPNIPADVPGDLQTTDPADTDANPSTGDPSADSLYGGLVLPLSDGSETFEYFRGTTEAYEQYNIKDLNSEIPGYARLQELTGVNIQWVRASDYNTQFPLMVASGDWSDAVCAYINNADLSAYAEDGIFLDLTDLIAENCPNYSRLRAEDAALARDTSNDNGRLLAFCNVAQRVQGSWAGPWVRADWLAEWGGGDLETYDEWEAFLSWTIGQHNPTTPYAFSSSGLDRTILSGFGLSNNWLVDNGVVKYSINQPAFKEYLEKMISWREKGIIGSCVFNGDSLTFNDYANGGCAIAGGHQGFFDLIYDLSEDPGFEMKALPLPVKNHGDKREIETGSSPSSRHAGLTAAIFSSCKNPALLARWFDFCYTETGSLLIDYGIEHVSYEFDETGKPGFNDTVLNDPDGVNYYTVMLKYCADQIPHFYDWSREINDGMPVCAKEASRIWDSNWAERLTYPEFASRTAEESETYTKIMSDIDTLVAESIPKFIHGEKSMDEWDSFLNRLSEIGIDTATNIQQAAYDRYIAR